MSFVFVALGGALGAAARYAVSLIPVKTQFPKVFAVVFSVFYWGKSWQL